MRGASNEAFKRFALTGLLAAVTRHAAVSLLVLATALS
jgi:hypothetical protein